VNKTQGTNNSLQNKKRFKINENDPGRPTKKYAYLDSLLTCNGVVQQDINLWIQKAKSVLFTFIRYGRLGRYPQHAMP
jgi:hypothetical protein